MAEKKQLVKEEHSKETPKICFVIMPISDSEGYDSGHFKRVYDHVIKPACLSAGFEPVRADNINKTNHIIIDILKHIVEADMAICDLSSRNPNVLYELGIRQAFNLPVTLINDNLTPRIFDIQTLRAVPYDSSLRVDRIEQAIPEITNALLNTYNDKIENINSIVQLLGIEAAQVTKTEVSNDTNLLLEAINNIGKRVNHIEDRFNGFVRNSDAPLGGSLSQPIPNSTGLLGQTGLLASGLLMPNQKLTAGEALKVNFSDEAKNTLAGIKPSIKLGEK